MTEEETKDYIRKTVTASCDAFLKYIQEQTIIVDKSTQKEIENCELKLINNHTPVKDYVWKELNKVGIIFTTIEN